MTTFTKQLISASANLASKPKICVEEFLDKYKNGEFRADALSQILPECEASIASFIRSPEQIKQFRPKNHDSFEERVTARQYLLYLFNLVIGEKDKSNDAQQLRQVLDVAEEALLRHLINSPKPSLVSAEQYQLRLTGAKSDRFFGKTLVRGKKHCLFRIDQFEQELKAANVPQLMHMPTSDKEICERFHQLPPVVKDLFFSRSYPDGNDCQDSPFSLIKDLLQFTDEETWHKLQLLSKKTSKKEFVQFLNQFVLDFVQYEKANYQLKLGESEQAAKGKIRKPSQKEQAIAQFCKPRKWIGKSYL